MNNKKVKIKTIRFKDYPEFRPNLTPRQIFLLGSFGGTYWRPITSKVTKKSYKNKHKEFPKSWWKGIPNKLLTSPVCNVSINNYGVKSGTSLRFWEKKGWMNKKDPYGWVQWYCRFYKGRRTPDDKRQIKRWLRFAGPKGRFKRRLVNMIKKKKTKYNDYTVSPVIRQGLQHWAYRLVPSDVRKKPVRKKKVKRKRKKVKRRRKFGSNSLEKYEDRIDNLKLKPVDKKKVEKILKAAIIRDKSSSENLNNNFIKKLEELKESKQKEKINNEYLFYSTLTKDKIKGGWNEYQKLFPKENSKYTPEQVKKATKIVKQFNDFIKGLESATCMEDINEIKKNKNYNKIITKKVLKVGSKWEDINDTIKLAEKEYLESLDSEKLKKVITNIDNTCVNTEASGCINKIVYNLEGPDKKYSLKGLELEKLQKEKENEKDESKIKDLEKKIKKKQEEMNELEKEQKKARITNECMIFGKKRKRKKKKVKRKRKKKKKKKVKRKRKKVKKKVKRRRRKFGTQRALEFRKASYEDLKRLGLPDGLVRKILLMSHMNLSPQLGASIRQLPRLRTPQENAQIVREILENGQNVIAPFINLRGANLAQLVLGDAVLRGANLHNADLRGAHLYGVNLQGANLKGANLRRADLTDGNLQGANLKGANLVNAELGANLKGANFQGANLDYCWIIGADLRETNLDNAFSLHMVRYNNQTRFPVGFDPTTRELPPDFGRIKQMINVDNFYHDSRLL